MSKLYHGSYMTVREPLVKAGRSNLDFGAGFYLTRLFEQSQKWARLVAGRNPGNEVAVVSKYELDDAVFSSPEFVFKRFDTYDISWLDFVVSCRNGRDCSDYDIVEGGVANDQVIDTVEDFEGGRITAEQALDQLRYQKPNNQVCIRNQKVIDMCLRFLGEDVFPLNDRQR